MVIGNGLLANEFMDEFAERSDIVIFASGVSNSMEIDPAAFRREQLSFDPYLQDQRKIVYFSTCSMQDLELAHTPYVEHKRKMELLVRQCRHHVIFRLPQLVGKTPNTNTLTNFIYSKIRGNSEFDIWQNAKRNIIDVQDVRVLASFLLNKKQIDRQTVNIACPISITMLDLVQIFEKVLRKKGRFSIIEVGGAYDIDLGYSVGDAAELGIVFNENYVERVIKKYYG